MSRHVLSGSLATSLIVSSVLLTLAPACGSRTGLLAADDSPDATVSPTQDAAPDSPVVQCMPGTFQLDRASSQVMFVLDRSGSMRFTLAGEDPGATAPISPNSRWRILQRSLEGTLGALESASSVEVGALFFPEEFDPDAADPDRACGVRSTPDVVPQRSTQAQILSVFDRTTPLGGTPTADAIDTAVTTLKSAARRFVSRAIVLATDGAPNCNRNLNARTCVCTQRDRTTCTQDPQNGPIRCLDDLRAVERVAAAYTNDSIPTYVIGIGSESDQPAYASTLNRMARAGGRSLMGATEYYDAQSPAALSQAFDEIATTLATCNFVTPSAPVRPEAITIDVGGVPVFRDPTHSNGWDWVDKNYGQIALYGEACTRVERGGGLGAVKATVQCD